jgi:N-acetylneuraminic acid mutarotase
MVKKIFIRSILIGSATVALIILFITWWWIFAKTEYPLKEIHPTPSGTYKLAKSLPVSITEAGGTAFRNKFYIVGGVGWRAQTFKHFYEYDPATDNWERLPDLPESINHPVVVATENHLYVVGGFQPLGLRIRGFMFADWNPLKTLYTYNFEKRQWTRCADLPEPRGAGGCTSTEGQLWYVGGINETKELSNSLFRFDEFQNQWETMPPMPTPRDHLRMEAIGNKLYAISGRKDDLRFNLQVVESFDIAQGKWTRKANFPTGRGGFSSVVYEGKIYTFGGENVWSCYSNVERYDPVIDQWNQLDDLPEARHGIQTGVINDRIHLISGGLKPRISVSGIHRIFDPN